MRLTKHQLKIIPRIQRKYNVSIGFLKSNLANIQKFLWYALSPRLVIKRTAIRKGNKQRVILNYYHLRRVLFDQAERKVIKTRRRNVQQWSRQMVSYLRRKYGVKEHIEITSLSDNLDAEDKKNEEETLNCGRDNLAPEEVSKQLKEQLELLRSGKRIVPLMESENKTTESSFNESGSSAEGLRQNDSLEEMPTTTSSKYTTNTDVCDSTLTVLDKTESVVQNTIETTPEKQIMGSIETRSEQPKHIYKADKNIYTDGETVELPPFDNKNKKDAGLKPVSRSEIFNSKGDNSTTKKSLSGSSNFLDMLMNKVRGKSILTEISGNVNISKPLSGRILTPERNSNKNQDNEHLTDSGEEFFGFDETERLPGMMLTPLVPFAAQSKGSTNGAFISESLNEFMRENSLESSNYIAKDIENSTSRRHRQATLDGLVTPDCTPPQIEMPLVPESLQKLRTVAERRQYLQKFNRNHKLSIINNEAAIYRELQRKMRHHKSKSVSQQLLQASNSQMPFTRQGWQAASFVTTEFNHYYYQTLKVCDGKEQELVRLPGVRGNNEERNKQPYQSRVPNDLLPVQCDTNTCGDALIWRDLKPLKTEPDKRRLNESPLPTVFKPCPLSHKPFQKPLDDETAPLLLAGGSMAVVRMPIVELEVFPALGKPLHEVAKRYLEYILPHGDITREWAEFSVSTLQQSTDCNNKGDSLNQSNNKINIAPSCSNTSFSFPIPYLNDRSHILVRRVVDRSEKLDETFETATSSLEDFSFRKDINETDNVLKECADVLSEMINSVAISCSEDSFIKIDPDGLHIDSEEVKTKQNTIAKEEKSGSNKVSADDSKMGSQGVTNKKQNRLLLELRRLNATIIDAAVKAEKGTKPCTKEYCALGCVCQSLMDDYPLRQHCGKSKCVIECTCKGTNQSRIMRLETDGRSITTEDAFMLRRQATARLARMEKEFTSTIVLTENETLLINESQYDKKRRCTKAPKRYEDFADTDDDYSGRSAANTSPKKTQNTAVVAIETTTDTSLTSAFSETTTELREPIYVKDKVLEKLKHCTVPLIRFQESQNMAVWCMVHELYKCYCGARATDGKPLVIEKDTGGDTTSSSNQANVGNSETTSTPREFAIPSTKARYSFEKVEQKINRDDYDDDDDDDDNDSVDEKKEVFGEKYANIKKRKSTDRKSQGSVVTKYVSTDEEKNESEDEDLEDSTDSDFDGERFLAKRQKTTTNPLERRGRPSEATFINKYFNTDPDSCRRIVVIPRKTYLRLNRKRRSDIQEYIAKNESKQTMLLLNEHILRSVYYHKHELEKQRREEPHESLLSKNKRKRREENVELASVEILKKEFCKGEAELEQKKQLNNKDRQIVALTDDESCQSSLSSLLSTSSNKPKTNKKSKSRSRRQKKKSTGAHNNEHDVAEFNKNSVVADDSNMSDAVNVVPTNATDIEMKEHTIKNLVDDVKLSNGQKCDNEQNISDNTEPSVPSVAFKNVDEECVATDINSAKSSEYSTALSLNMDSSSSLPRSRMDFFRDVVRSMNSLVNKKMQDIGLALKRESKVIPAPNNEILCIIKWSNFLDAFTEGFVFIWQVKLRDDQTFFAATISNVMPMVLNAVGVVNIEALPLQQLPLLGRMLMERCRVQQTRDLAIVMQGRAKYWLVKGFLRADKSSACAKPTPKSHPLLTRKINVLSSLLAKQHIRELNKKATDKQKEQSPHASEKKDEVAAVSIQNIHPTQQCLLKQKPSSLANSEQKTISSRNSNNNDRSIFNKQKSRGGSAKIAKQPTMGRCPVPSSTTRNSATDAMDKKKQNMGSLILQDFIGNQSQFLEMKTNIEFRKVYPGDIEELHGLDVTTEPHRWLVLDLWKDFSHIYVPDFQELVSLDRIQKVMEFSRQKQKIVKLQFFQNAAYDAFVTPTSERKIYFGPLKLNLPPPSLILLQSVDGKMMLREAYQKMHSIQADIVESTTAFWMVRKNGQVNFDFEMGDNSINDNGTITHEDVTSEQQRTDITPSVINPESDDDCMIVENDETPVTFLPLIPQSQPNIAVKPISELQSQNDPQSTASVQRTNFTIQASSTSNRLQITNLGSAPNTPQLDNITEANCQSQFQVLSNANGNELQMGSQMSLIPLQLPTNNQIIPLSNAQMQQQQIIPVTDKESNSILCGLPPNAIITGVAPAPDEAPYGTTIFISSLAPQNTVTDGNGVQLTDTQIITTLSQSNSPAPIPSNTPSNANSPTKSTNVGGVKPTIRFLTPDVRVTATGEPDSPSATALTTISNQISFTSKTQAQSGSLDKDELSASSMSNQSLAESHTTLTNNTEQEQHQVDVTANTLSNDWKRFLLNNKSKSSTIGSTTITKMVEYNVNNGLPIDGVQMNVEDEFEPSASIVFKRYAISSRNDELLPNESQTSTQKVVNNNNNSSNTSTSIITTTTKTTNNTLSPITVPHTVSLAYPPTAIPKAATIPTTKAQVMTLPLRKLSPLSDTNKLRQFSTAKFVAKSTSLPYSTASRIITNNAATTNTTVAISQTPRITVTKPSTLNQSLAQQLKMSSQPTRQTTVKTYGMRQSLPLTSSSRTTTNTTSYSPIISTVGGSAPKPLINVRPAVPIPQRLCVTIPQTKRYSDSALLATTMDRKVIGGTTTTPTSTITVPTTATTMMQRNMSGTIAGPAPKSNVAIAPKPNYTSTNNINTFKMGITKCEKNADEQYGVFCSSTNDSSPRFWAKRVHNSYIVKVPGLSSVVHRSDLESVGVYLNQHLMSQSPAMKSKLPIKWKFVPSDQLNLPIKMLTTHKDGTTSEKVLVRRFKASENNASEPKLASSGGSPVCNFLKDVANAATTPMPDNKCSETILIED